MIKHDIYNAINFFFNSNEFDKFINISVITLIPKVEDADRVKVFRPISYYTVMYKIISKILTQRMKTVMGDIIHPSQAGFIPGRQLGDNVLLATKLISGYGRKHMFPSCMIKINMKNDYDSMEWPFLEGMLQEFGFQNIFVQWIMTYVRTVSYSILTNGNPIQSFQAAKGPKQGVPTSYFLFAIFLEYLSRCLGTLRIQDVF